MKGRRWTQRELDLIRSSEAANKVLAEALNRSVSSIKHKRWEVKHDMKGQKEDLFGPPVLSQEEKVTRIHKLAAEMHVRLAK